MSFLSLDYLIRRTVISENNIYEYLVERNSGPGYWSLINRNPYMRGLYNAGFSVLCLMNKICIKAYSVYKNIFREGESLW